MTPEEVEVLLGDVDKLLKREQSAAAARRLSELRSALVYRRDTGRWEPGRENAWARFAAGSAASTDRPGPA